MSSDAAAPESAAEAAPAPAPPILRLQNVIKRFGGLTAVDDVSCWVCGGPAGQCAALAPLTFRQCRACGFVFSIGRPGMCLHPTADSGP